MSGRARPAAAAALAVGLLLGACEGPFFHEPGPDTQALGLSYGLAPSVANQASPVEDFDNADQARIRVVMDSRELVERVVPVSPADNGVDKVARVEVPVGDEATSVSVEAQLLRDGQPVLEGFRSFGVDPDAEEPAQAEMVMLPLLTEEQTRAVLSWSADPRDLDSHMTGPDHQGGRFHVYFASRGSASSPPFVSLDTDDTQGFGPETTTIWDQAAGTYCYSVHKFSGTGALSDSEATVEVFQGDQRVRSFDVPQGAGDVWTVFRLDEGGITPIDRIDQTEPPGVCE